MPSGSGSRKSSTAEEWRHVYLYAVHECPMVLLAHRPMVSRSLLLRGLAALHATCSCVMVFVGSLSTQALQTLHRITGNELVTEVLQIHLRSVKLQASLQNCRVLVPTRGGACQAGHCRFPYPRAGRASDVWGPVWHRTSAPARCRIPDGTHAC